MLAGSISSLTEAKRTAGEPSAAFLGSRLEVVFWSGAVKKDLSETTAYVQGRKEDLA
jgi:hypothetical protein